VIKKKMPTYGITFSFSNPENSFTGTKLGEIFYAGVWKMFLRISVYRWFISFQRAEKILLVCLQVRRTRKNKQTFSLRKC
jgi:hypothetical protein